MQPEVRRKGKNSLSWPYFHFPTIMLYIPSFHWKAVNKHKGNLVITTIKIKRHEKIFCYGNGKESKIKLKDWLEHKHNLGIESGILKNGVSDKQWGKAKTKAMLGNYYNSKILTLYEERYF